MRIADLKRACGGPYPGADADAIGSAGRLSFDALPGAIEVEQQLPA